MSNQQVVAEGRSLASVGPGSYRVERPASVRDVVGLIERHKIQIVDLKFTDLPGLWQHFSITLPEVHDDLFSEGIGFDGSSIRGFQEIHESDMLLKPDPGTAFVDPVCEVPTLSIICDVMFTADLLAFESDFAHGHVDSDDHRNPVRPLSLALVSK